jgi:renalase
MEHSHIVVGAGLTGLLLAKKLKEKGHSPLIIEKSRGVGGRIATRRIEDLGFDHGLSFIPNVQECLDLLEELELKHLVKLSPQGIALRGGMSLLPKALGRNLQILKDQRIEEIAFRDNYWHLRSDKGTEFETPLVILTAPLPQGLELLQKNNIQSAYQRQLGSITYSKALMGLFILKKDHPTVPETNHVLVMKERDLHPQGLVIKSSDEFANKYFDAPEAEVLEHLRRMTEEHLQLSLECTHQELKKWRYASPLRNFNEAYIQYSPGLFLAGDSFVPGGVGGSIRSALALSNAL